MKKWRGWRGSKPLFHVFWCPVVSVYGRYGWVFGFWWLVVDGHGWHWFCTLVPSDSWHWALFNDRPGFRLWHVSDAMCLLTTHRANVRFFNSICNYPRKCVVLFTTVPIYIFCFLVFGYIGKSKRIRIGSFTTGITNGRFWLCTCSKTSNFLSIDL